MSIEKKTPEIQQDTAEDKTSAPTQSADEKAQNPNEEKEIGGFKDAGLPEPTRFGDWEVKGRCSDF